MNGFNSAYQGTPPWDIGRPQPEIVALAQAGEIHGAVLDVGCGTGENALYLASLGHSVTGIDGAPLAIEKGQVKAATRQLNVSFIVGDALELAHLDKTFDTVIDCGFFHTLADDECEEFAKHLHAAMRAGGTYWMLCFSENERGYGGPRRVTQARIRATFGKGWKINSIRAARFESNEGDRQAWLASITRKDDQP